MSKGADIFDPADVETEIDMANGQLRVVEKRRVAAGNAGFPIGQVSISEAIEDALDVQSQRRPSRKRSFAQCIYSSELMKNSGFILHQVTPSNRRLDGSIEDFCMLRVVVLFHDSFQTSGPPGKVSTISQPSRCFTSRLLGG